MPTSLGGELATLVSFPVFSPAIVSQPKAGGENLSRQIACGKGLDQVSSEQFPVPGPYEHLELAD
jgi:hypothetical protein